MRRRRHVIFWLALCLLGTGAQWDALQVFAWGRMIASHSRTMSWTAAVKKTFDGESCGLCRAVAAAKQQEQSIPALPQTKIEGKILLFCQPSAPVVVDAACGGAWRPVDSTADSPPRLAPPLPPPRQAAA